MKEDLSLTLIFLEPQIFSVKLELSQAGGGYEAIIPHTLAH